MRVDVAVGRIILTLDHIVPMSAFPTGALRLLSPMKKEAAFKFDIALKISSPQLGIVKVRGAAPEMPGVVRPKKDLHLARAVTSWRDECLPKVR